MLHGKELILATKRFAVEDRSKSWRLFLGTLLLLVLAYLGALVNVHIIPQLICAVLAGLLSVRMFIIYHDYLHKTILQKSSFAKVIFFFFGLYILAPFSIWRRSHDYHHAHNSKLYTSSIGSFPLVTKNDFLAASKKERRIYLFIRHPFTIALGYIFVFFWGMCIRTLLVNPKKHIDCLIALFFHLAIATGIYFTLGFQSLLLGFFVPLFISNGLGAYLFYAQHNFPAAIYKPKEKWSYSFAALHSSSYMKMSPIMHWFTGNIGYHHIHHINPRIPFYRLPEVYAQMPEFQQPGTTSLAPSDIHACFSIKAWDPEHQRMITLKEVYTSNS
ncbi:MAG: fatty acid desaturase [Saprospiraceae bacterium]|nr:fatty acid desaturase [Saprospiraceae bacterium]